MTTNVERNTIKAANYGELLAIMNDLDLVSFEEDGGYQGDFLVVLEDESKLYYYIGVFGSCPGCDWIRDVEDENGEIPYTEALAFCGGLKPAYIVPKDTPLTFVKVGEFERGWVLQSSGPTNN